MRISKSSKRFLRAENGMAAVEFAFLLPVMITLFFGVVESSAALSCRAQVSEVAATAADLVAQGNTATPGSIQNVMNAGNTILYPYYDSTAGQGTAKGTKPNITVASIVDVANGADPNSGKVAWVCSQGTATVAVGQTIALNGLMTKNGSVIYAEVNYDYVSPTSKMITGTLHMNNKFYSKPRRVAQITGPLANCNS